MTTDGVIDLKLKSPQVDRLSGNAASTGGFVPRGDQLSRIGTPFDYDENLTHSHRIG